MLHTSSQPSPGYAPFGQHPHSQGAGPGSLSTPSPSAPAASFRVVENNDFKQLPHICLAFRPGSDAAVKQFLAFRLGELRADAGVLSAELERTQARGAAGRREGKGINGNMRSLGRRLPQCRSWTGLDGAGRGWAGLDRAGQGWTGLDRASSIV